MAEIVGLVVSIAAFALQIGGAVETVRALREFTSARVADQLECLSNRLELFRKDLLYLKRRESHPIIKPAVQHAYERFRVIKDVLQNLQRKLHPERNPRPDYLTRVKLILSGKHVEEQIKKTEDNISRMSLDVQRACMVVLLLDQHIPTSRSTVIFHDVESSMEESEAAAMIQECGIETEPTLEDSNDATMIQKPTIINGQTVTKTQTAGCRQTQVFPRGTNRHRCGEKRHCDCLCHLKGKQSGRFWSLEYTPLSIPLKRPKTGRCDSSQFCFNFRVALSNYGIPLAIVAGLNITADAISNSIPLTLRTEKIVKYTSPGFETLCRLEHGYISLEEARMRFVELNRSEGPLKNHRDPSGQSYAQKLLAYPWHLSPRDQLSLLRIFKDEFEITLGDQDCSFLTTCARWIGEGPHLDLLDAILECGFDTTTVHSPLWEQWPASCSPNWISEQYTPDPFFVEYLATLVKDNPHFSGSSPLCNAVLVGSNEDIAACMRRTQPALEDDTTFLGQSPLHLAITNPDVCQLLLDAGHDPNVADKCGVTPLMYAAAMDQRQTVEVPGPSSNYAISRGHGDLVLDALGTVQEVCGIEAVQLLSKCAALQTITIWWSLFESRTPFLCHLFKNLADVNMSIDDPYEGVKNDNLMHYVVSVDEASALVRCGFNQFDLPNSDGKLAINSLIRRHCGPALVKFCIERCGMSVRNKEKEGRTMLFDVFSRLEMTAGLERTQQTLAIMRLCLDAGVDIFAADNCRCPCSPGGCTISSVFPVGPFETWFENVLEGMPERIWTLEWVTLVEEHRGVDAARQVLLSLLRRGKCKESDIDITHTCCHRGRGIHSCRLFADERPKPLTDEDIAEILEEESEFIEILEDEMEQLASKRLDFLWSEWMLVFKADYDAHVKAMEMERAKYPPPMQPQREFHVDYRNDSYCVGYHCAFSPTAYPVARKLASYALWLQYDRAIQNSDITEVGRPAGWFEKRVSLLRQFLRVMGLSTEAVVAEIRQLWKQEPERGAISAKLACKLDLDFLV
ncbi:hypothetical protein V8F20_009857 [Naviculisporaceae sp. PSN 640]